MAFVINVAPVDSRDYVLSRMNYSVLVRNTVLSTIPAITKLTNAGPMLAHGLRNWPSITTAPVQRIVFAGLRSTQ